LAVDVYESNKDEQGKYLLSKSEAYDLASNIYQWHKQTFNVYWEWIDDVIEDMATDTDMVVIRWSKYMLFSSCFEY